MNGAEPQAPARRPGPPGPWRMALELRAPWEAAASLLAWRWITREPRGDGHAVLVLPGLAASDRSTALMRRFLRTHGWRAHGWRLGRNLGPRDGVFEACLHRVQAVHAATGRRVSLVGWSLGGVYARELAKRLPQSVRQVVTLGSPMPGHGRASNARRLYEAAAGARAYAPELMARLHEPVPVPCTSIYSRSDGIVHWRASLLPPGAQRQNIRVPASHVGLGLNPVVLNLLAERLSQPEHGWRPYRGVLPCDA